MIHTLEADGVQLEFGLRKILSDIYLKCETGSITGLLGRNGEGKTCLLNIIYGSLEAGSKSIRFDNVSVFEAYKRPDLLGYLPQFNFVPESLRLKKVFRDFELLYDEFETIFPEFSGRRNESIGGLSGGQRRLTEVYLMTKSRARFVMLDEPFSHLSPLYIEKIMELLTEEKKNKGFLVTDHLYRHVCGISDAIYLLKSGKSHLIKNMKDIEILGYANIDV